MVVFTSKITSLCEKKTWCSNQNKFQPHFFSHPHTNQEQNKYSYYFGGIRPICYLLQVHRAFISSPSSQPCCSSHELRHEEHRSGIVWTEKITCLREKNNLGSKPEEFEPKFSVTDKVTNKSRKNKNHYYVGGIRPIPSLLHVHQAFMSSPSTNSTAPSGTGAT